MSDEKENIAVQLDQARRLEIDGIKQRFEDWARTQTELNIELKHEMELVVKGQESLKERFEIGTARTLKELKDSFDSFRVEWGEKKRDDEIRDEKIQDNKKDVDAVKVWILRLAMALFGPISVGLTIAFIVWAFTKFQ